jgi:hypothetical protein
MGDITVPFANNSLEPVLPQGKKEGEGGRFIIEQLKNNNNIHMQVALFIEHYGNTRVTAKRKGHTTFKKY